MRLRRRYGRSSAGHLSVEEASKLSPGSLLWWNGQALVVVSGGLAPVSILPKTTTSGRIPDGEAVASFGGPFTLIAEGGGKVPTYETAHRKVMAWWRASGRK